MLIYTLQKISNIVKSKLYGTEYYTKAQLINLCKELTNIKEQNLIGINEGDSEETIIRKINNFVRDKVNIRREYFERIERKRGF